MNRSGEANGQSWRCVVSRVARVAMAAALTAGCGGSASAPFPSAGAPGSGGGAATGGACTGGHCGGTATGGAATGGQAGATGGAATGGSPTGGASGTGGTGGSGTKCTTAADCAGRPDNKTVCDVSSGTCVACVADRDCAIGMRCASNTCTAAPCNNSLDCPASSVCDTTLGHCVECVTNAECASGDHCVGDVCRPPCRSDKDCTPLGLLCDLSSGNCVNCVSSSDCALDQYCKSGVCNPDVCVAGTSDCVANAVVTCNADGSGRLPAVACSATQTCVDGGDTASCKDQICSPLVRGCAAGAEQVVACSSDGLSQQVTEDCGAKGQVCVAATCKDVVCTAGALFCSGMQVRQCSAKGDNSVLVATCSNTLFCNATTAQCTTQLCVPTQPACNGQIATTCNSDGSGYVSGGVDCASSGQKCIAGSCKAVICNPNGRFCSANTIQQCSADGTSSTLVLSCASTQYCDAASVTCKAQICTPGSAVCNSNIATTCNADGSGYVNGGTDCSTTGQRCVSGTCKSLVCTPSARFCANGSVQLCSADGTSSTLYQTCTASQYCDSVSATCKAQICSPNQPTCNGNSIATCNADGSGYATTGASCSPQYCVSGKCQNALFFEDWEDGDTAGWTPGTDGSSRTVTTAQAANGTAHSLIITGGSSVHLQGLYHTFSALTPSTISWWVMPTSTTAYGGYMVLTNASTSNFVAYVYFESNGKIRDNSGTETPTAYSASQWYHLELRNINWTAHTYDWYVNGTLIHASAPFSSAQNAITRIDLYNFDSTTAYFDEISFQ